MRASVWRYTRLLIILFKKNYNYKPGAFGKRIANITIILFQGSNLVSEGLFTALSDGGGGRRGTF